MQQDERSSSLAFCRVAISRIADKGHLQRAHIETLLSERVVYRLVSAQVKLNYRESLSLQEFCHQFFKLFDHKNSGVLVQEEWIALLKENTR